MNKHNISKINDMVVFVLHLKVGLLVEFFVLCLVFNESIYIVFH